MVEKRRYNFVYGYSGRNNYFTFFKNANIDIMIISCVAFLVPILFSFITIFPNQLLIGIIVNAALAYMALNYEIKKIWSVILLPSFGTLLSGLVFGNLSIFLIYLIPFIWASNFIFVYIIKNFKIHKQKNYFLGVFASSTAKAALLTAVSGGYIAVGTIPLAMFLPMSLIQLVTALCGGFIAGIYFLKPKKQLF